MGDLLGIPGASGMCSDICLGRVDNVESAAHVGSCNVLVYISGTAVHPLVTKAWTSILELVGFEPFAFL